MEKNANTPTAKSTKKVSFGKVKVRLVFDESNQNSTQDEDTDERSSQELTWMEETHTHLQKQPKKSILKSTVGAASLERGPNALKGKQKNMFEWDKMDRKFWEPAKETARKGRKRHGSPSDGDASLSFAKREADATTLDKGENSNFTSVLSKQMTKNTNEKTAFKNNEKWKGIIGKHKYELKKFVGIYQGVEADWEQTRQSLLKIGVDVSEDELQNPRDFVTIMNMLLCLQQEKSDEQTLPKTRQDLAEHQLAFQQDLEKITSAREEVFGDSNSSSSLKEKQKSMSGNRVSPSNEEDLIIKEELMNVEHSTTQNEKLEHSKSSKKFMVKEFLSGKKEKTDRKIMKEDKKCTKDNLSPSPRIGCEKNMTDEKISSFDKLRSLMDRSSSNTPKHLRETKEKPKRSQSENNLDYFSETKKQKARKKDDTNSMADIDSEMGNSAGSSLHRERSFSDNNLNLPRRVSMDHNLMQDMLCSSTWNRGSSVIDEKHPRSKNRERPKVVKRDSWFLTKKQNTKGEHERASDLNEAERVGGKDIEEKTTENKSSCVLEECSSSENLNSEKDSEETNLPGFKRRPTLLMISNQSGSEKEDSETPIPSDSGLSTNDVSCENNKCYGKNSELTTPNVNGSELPNESHVGAVHQGRNDMIISKDTNNNESTKVNFTKSKKNKSTECSLDTSEQALNQIEETELPGTTEACHVDKKIRLETTIPTLAGNELRREVASLSQMIEKDMERNGKNNLETNDFINENNQFLDGVDDECFRKFLNDVRSIDTDTKRSLKSEEYRDRARKRYRPKQRDKKLALKIIDAIHMNTAPEICLTSVWF